MKLRYTILLLSLLGAVPAWATTYYVDNCVTVGSDANNGTSTATSWLTVARVNAGSFNPGDSVLFQGGCTWREQLTVPSSGISGDPITFGSYGTGLPIISAANVISSWTESTITAGTNFTYPSGSPIPNGYWLFSAASGNQKDSSNNGNTLVSNGGAIAATTGPTTTGGVTLEGAFLASSSSDYYSIANWSLSPGFPGEYGVSTDFTIGLWVNPADTSTRDIMSTNCGYGLFNSSGGSGFQIDDTSYTPHSIYGIPLAPGTWYFLAGTYNHTSGVLTYYIDGGSQGTGTTATMVVGNPFTIGGANNCGTNNSFNGTVAQPFVFSSVLTAAQITSIYDYGLAGGKSINVYSASDSTQPLVTAEDGTQLTPVANESLLTPGTFWWNSSASEVFIRTFQDASPSNHTIEAGTRQYGVLTNSHSYLVVQDLEVTLANNHGIEINHSWVDVTLSNNTISNSANTAIQVYASGSPATGAIISGNTCLNNNYDCVDVYGISSTYYPTQTAVTSNNAKVGGGGFECDYYSDNCVIQSNSAQNINPDGTFTCDGCRASTFEGNVGVNGNLICLQAEDYEGNGWSPPTNVSFLNNNCYSSTNGIGALVVDAQDNLTFKDNIIASNTNPVFDLGTGPYVNLYIDYQTYYSGNLSAGWSWGAGPSYGTLSEWQAANSVDTHSVAYQFP